MIPDRLPLARRMRNAFWRVPVDREIADELTAHIELQTRRYIEDATDDMLRIEEGSLYPALYRMERRGWISAAWGKSEIGQRIKVYSLTTVGRAQLRAESAQWDHFTTAVAKLMENA